MNGHWYRLTDKTAGVRAYAGERKSAKFWVGFYNGKMSCRFSGLPLTMVARSASEQEYNIYPELLKRLTHILGRAPRSVRADIGLGVKKVYLHNSERGIFSIIPVRGRNQEPTTGDRERFDRERFDRERFDRDAILRCENCGGPTEFISFSKEPKPRVFFRCTHAPLDECAGKQSMLCEDDPRFVLPLWQNTELYHALQEQTFQYERVHRLARQRNGSGADSATTRPKRKGVAWQQLRCDATVFRDWLKACFRQGWLPIPGMTVRNPADGVEVPGKDGLDRFNLRRLRQQLHVPYGYRARRLALGPVRHKQPAAVKLSVPSIDGPAPTGGQRHSRGGRRRPLTPLPKTLPPMPETKDVINADPDRLADGKSGRSGKAAAIDARLAAAAAHIARLARQTGSDTADPAEPSAPATGPPDDTPF